MLTAMIGLMIILLLIFNFWPNMIMYYLRYFSFIGTLLTLLGCNSGDDDTKISPPQELESLVSYSDITIQNKVSTENYAVNLDKFIYNPKKETIYINTIEPTKNDCEFNYDPTSSNLSFYVKTKSVDVCEFSYSLITKDNILPKKTIRFLTSSDEVQSLLRPISLPLGHLEDFSIDLTTELSDVDWTDYSLTDSYSSDSGITFSTSGNLIQGTANDTTGINRIFILLKNKANTKLKFGIISISVSNPSNTIPTADSFLAASEAKLETLINITIDDKYINDTDGDDLTLIDVYSYSGNVTLAPSIDNKTFAFYTKEPGTYDISYVVSDSKGGLASAIARIETEKRTTIVWESILEKQKKYFPPLTVEQAELTGFNYQNNYSESHNLSSGLIDYNVTLFSYDKAKLLCSIRGMDLPTQDDIADLLLSPHSNFMLNDAPYDWPYKHNGEHRGYWLKSLKTGEYKTFNFETGASYSALPSETNLSMCVQKGVLTKFSSDNNPIYIHGGLGSTTLRATLETPDGHPLDGQPIYFYTDSVDTTLSNTMQVSDSSGESITDIFSSIEQNVTVYANYLTDRLQINIQFLMDKISNIKLEITDYVMKKGDSQPINIAVNFDSGITESNPNTMPDFSINSTDKDVIGLELTPSTYIAHAKSVGSSEIKAKRNTVESNTLSMEVINPATSLKLSPKSLAFFEAETVEVSSGEIQRYDGTITDILSLPGKEEVLWSTDKPGIIDYDPEKNLITAIGVGNVHLTATVKDTPSISDVININIIPPLKEIAFKKSVMTTDKGVEIKNQLVGIALDDSEYDIPPESCSAELYPTKKNKTIQSHPEGTSCTFLSDEKAGLYIVTAKYRGLTTDFGVNLNPKGTLREIVFHDPIQAGAVGTIHHNLMTATYSDGTVDETITVIPEECTPIYDEPIGDVYSDSYKGCFVQVDSSHNDTVIAILGRYRGEIAGYQVKTGSGGVYFEDPVVYSEQKTGIFNKVIVEDYNWTDPEHFPMSFPYCTIEVGSSQVDFTQYYDKPAGTITIDGAPVPFDNYQIQASCWTQVSQSASIGSEILVKAADDPATSSTKRRAFYLLKIVDNTTPLEKVWFVDSHPMIPDPTGLSAYMFASKLKAKPKGPGMFRILSPIGYYDINNNDTLNHITGSGCEAINLDTTNPKLQPTLGLGRKDVVQFENVGTCNLFLKGGAGSDYKVDRYKVTATIRDGLTTTAHINGE
ncbi:TPA: hypothetical protein ACX6RR_000868 [Photobacterium damselae]